MKCELERGQRICVYCNVRHIRRCQEDKPMTTRLSYLLNPFLLATALTNEISSFLYINQFGSISTSFWRYPLKSVRRKALGWISYFTPTLGDGVGLFNPTLTPEVWLNDFYITLLSWEFLLNGTISLEALVETDNSCCAPQFPFIASCYKIS